MKGSLFPHMSHAGGLQAGDISPSAALRGAERHGCLSVFVWSFELSITAEAVRWRERGAESTARHRLMATASDLLWGLPSAELEDKQLQQPCFSRLLAGKPSPGIPGVLPHAEALPAVLTCASQPRTPTDAANTSL